MTSRISYRPATAADYDAILALNTAAVPSVNLIAADVLSGLHRQAVALLVGEDCAVSNSVTGFVLALDETSDYDSVNYTYFQENYPQFVYVDRIVVSPQYQQLGIGRHFYERLFNLAAGKPVTCEVNLLPPNPNSLAFHKRLGFVQVAEQDTEGGSKRVALMVRNP